MAKKAEFCYCKNTYTRTKCKIGTKKCKAHPIWKQGIGKTQKIDE